MPTIAIDTFDDSRISDYQNVRDADLRSGRLSSTNNPNAEHLFIIESAMIVRRFVEAQSANTSHPWKLKSLLLTQQRATELADVISQISNDVPIYVASDEQLMQRIAGYSHHHGTLAVVHRPSFTDESIDDFLRPFATQQRLTLLAIEGVTNVDNIGSIFRNAAAFGADGIILDRTSADPLFRKAIRVSMGHVFNVSWIVVDRPLVEIFRIIKATNADTRIIAAETTSATHIATEISQMHWPERSVIAFGSERYGLQQQTLDTVDSIIEIPMTDAVDSLNVAVAVAVILHERGLMRPACDG